MSGPPRTGAPETSDARYSALLRVLGAMLTPPPPTFAVMDSARLETGMRYRIAFLAEPADARFHEPPDEIHAYLFVPDHEGGQRLPAVVAIHQDGPQSHLGAREPAGLAGAPDQHYGLELFERGYVVLCPDRFGHAERRRLPPGDTSTVNPERDDMLFEHRVGQLMLEGRTAFGKETYDLMRAVDVLAALPYVDADRIGAIGHSAGGNALVYLMFADPRVRAGVSSCGFFDLVRFYDEEAPRRRLTAAALPGLLEAGTAADYLAYVAPRPLLLTRGLWEWGRDEPWGTYSEQHAEETRTMEAHARRRYDALGASSALRVEYFEDEGGNHAFPLRLRNLAYDWLDANLR